MDKIICIEEQTWRMLLGKLESLSATAQRLQQKFNPQTSDGWIDGQDVCQRLDITKRTLQSYRERGRLPFSNIGGKFFYRESDITEYLQSKTVKRR